MRSEIKYCVNHADMNENQMLRNQALTHNQQNPYSKIEVPQRLEPIYRTTFYNFRVANVLDFVIEPTEDRDIICHIHPKGELRITYDILIESKLNLLFNGE